MSEDCFLRCTMYLNENKKSPRFGKIDNISQCAMPCDQDRHVKTCNWWMSREQMEARWAKVPKEFTVIHD